MNGGSECYLSRPCNFFYYLVCDILCAAIRHILLFIIYLFMEISTEDSVQSPAHTRQYSTRKHMASCRNQALS